MEKIPNIEQPLPGEEKRPDHLNVLITENKYKALEDAATKDPLTGLLNRRAWEEAISVIVNTYNHQPNNHKEEYTIISLDIDHFKKINDTYGHDAGDVVLKTVAEQLRKKFRQGDIIARVGGEEFLILVQGANVATINEHLSRDNGVPGINFPVTLPSGEALEITFSGGTYPVKPTSKEEVHAAATKADLLLYEVKRSARNHIKSELGESTGTNNI